MTKAIEESEVLPVTAIDIEDFVCPLPLRDYPHVVMGHGGGGKLSAELIEHVFLPAFNNTSLAALGDSTPLQLPGSRIAVSTDSFVVQPLFFPGGSIGELAVYGTVNDLAMSGAKPLYLTAGFILEEGLPIDSLMRISRDMARAATKAGVKIIAGDTKVVERGHGDGCYINTTGIGVLPAERNISIDRARPGDVVLVSGTMGDHGMAVMSVREGLEFESPIQSDTCSLADLVEVMLAHCPDIRVLRDPTRGGLATSLNEIAGASACGIKIDEHSVPVDPIVRSACEFLGLDPLLVANEGKLVAVVPATDADRLLNVMRSYPVARSAAIIGTVVEDSHKLVVARTSLGSNRVIPMPIGQQLPRIC
ncbi:MAG: hydrogenase expression/formation protein HypE [Pirellulaceae bacterium]|nr:hydrogenase expression/formation protein HypE [Pirellulaceae bacterium]